MILRVIIYLQFVIINNFTARTKIFAESRKKKPKKRSVRVVHEHFKVFSDAEYA